MNKSELIDAVAKESGLTKADAAKAVDAFKKCAESRRHNYFGGFRYFQSGRTCRASRFESENTRSYYHPCCPRA